MNDRGAGSRYERTFELSVPRERAWECFTDPAERSAWLAEPDEGTTDHYTTAGGTSGFSVAIDEVVPLERLRWTEHHAEPPGSIEICVVFEDAATGSRITVTQSRFGAIEDTHWQASHGGWDEAIADLAFYIRTGIRARRHFAERAATGFMGWQTLAGVEVAQVFPDGFGAQAGLQPGDLLLELGGAPIFTMAQVFTVLRTHRPGDTVTVSYARGKDLVTSKAALSSPADYPQ